MKVFLEHLIKEAGAFILSKFRTAIKVSNKEGINNLVTEADQACERLIKERILEAYPEHGIIAEEFGNVNEDAAYQWIVDPIDGTVNYANGLQLYCVSIALVKDGTPILGAIYSPVLDELFFAEKGKGATLNGNPISVSENSVWEQSFLVTGFPYHFPENIAVLNIFTKIVGAGLPVRRLGSAALDLAYVAAGRFDGFWEFNLSPWDIAAGYLIVEEAGGTVTNLEGLPGRYSDKQTVASNGSIHAALLEKINAYK